MSSNLDPGKASRVLDLLETATRRGDLDKNEAVSILSSWLADQKRPCSRGGSCQHSSWPACSSASATSPTEPPPLPPRRWLPAAHCQQQPEVPPASLGCPIGTDPTSGLPSSRIGQQNQLLSQQQQQQRKPHRQRKHSPRWLRLIASCVVAKEAAQSMEFPEQQQQPPPPLADHEYALYGGDDASQSATDSSGAATDFEGDYGASYYGDAAEEGNGDNRRSTTGSNTVDSGVANC